MSKTFDGYETYSAKKEKLIKNLREEVSSLNSKFKKLKSDVENQEWYSRRIGTHKVQKVLPLMNI